MSAVSVSDELKNHTLASTIISTHSTPRQVLDDPDLSLLQEFIKSGLSTESRDKVLKGRNWTANSDQVNGKEGSSLAGFLVARYGSKEPGLDDDEWEEMKVWFAKDGHLIHTNDDA